MENFATLLLGMEHGDGVVKLGSEWLFDKDMLARQECVNGGLAVRLVVGANANRLNFGDIEQIMVIAVPVWDVELFGELLGALRDDVGDGDDFDSGDTLVSHRVTVGDAACANNANASHGFFTPC
jgi:hypothetical protein